MPPRKRPGQEPEPEPKQKPSNGRKGKKASGAAKYSIYAVNEEEGTLTSLGDHAGRNANDAVKNYLGNDPDDGDYNFEVVPVRNKTTVKVSIGSVKKVTLS